MKIKVTEAGSRFANDQLVSQRSEGARTDLQGPAAHRSYPAGARRHHLGSKGYLEYLDERLGYPKGTLYDLCLTAAKSKTKTRTKTGVKVTYRGDTEREVRRTHHSIPVRKAIFLIEVKIIKAGEGMDRVIQVHLEK